MREKIFRDDHISVYGTLIFLFTDYCTASCFIVMWPLLCNRTDALTHLHSSSFAPRYILKKDPNAPKRPMTSFNYFRKHVVDTDEKVNAMSFGPQMQEVSQ